MKKNYETIKYLFLALIYMLLVTITYIIAIPCFIFVWPFCSKTSDGDREYDKWHMWFAWRPVVWVDGSNKYRIYWFVSVYRKYICSKYSGMTQTFYKDINGMYISTIL